MIIIEKNKKIKIYDSVIDLMRKNIQKGFFSLESGGILIGKENLENSNLIIKYITEPFKGDKRKHSRFNRLDFSHIAIYNNIYETSSKTYRYIGEWHTHPEPIPHYSIIDSNNWITICKGAPTDMFFYHIIIGYEAFSIWKIKQPLLTIELVQTIYWENIN